MEVSIIVAMAKNGVIGKNNTLIWKLSDDLKFFRKCTTGHTVIMGRKTFDSIGKALPKRTNIIVSRNLNLQIENCLIASSLNDAIELAKSQENNQEVFIIGGQQIYELAQNLATKLYLTKVNAEPEGDAFFDFSPYENWEIINTQNFEKSETNEFSFEIIEFKRP